MMSAVAVSPSVDVERHPCRDDDLVFLGRVQPSGDTEPVLPAPRLQAKAEQRA